jgi:glycerol-3-phosphate acyltransferase PlsY
VPPFLLFLLAFLCGSLPFSVWIGKLFLHADVRRYGDGNPGATNVFRAGSRLAGLLALLLDVSKAAAPVGLAYFNLGLRGPWMFLVALAPLLGHVFSPFLGWRGGKGVAAALGVWIGLTLWKASAAGVVFAVLGILLTATAGWAVMLAMLGILACLLAWLPEPLFLAAWAGQMAVLGWTHRADLRRPPSPRRWLARLVSSRSR